MLEGILLTIVLSYAFGYIALKAIYFLFDRPEKPEQRKQWIQELLNKPQPSPLPEHTEYSRPYSEK